MSTNFNALTANQLKPLLTNMLRAGLVPLLAGDPGIGKSDLIKQIAEVLNLKVIDHRLSTSDPTDLTGLPDLSGEKATFKPFDIFPIEGDEIPDGYDGWLLLLDELPSASPTTQAAAYKLLLDKEVGQHKLHPRCVPIGAGNLESSGAYVNRLNTAMQSRLVHFEMRVDPDEWLAWAYSNDIDHRITSFIAYAPEKLHIFDPAHHDKTFPCPRTWGMLSKYIDVVKDVDFKDLPAMEGTIGQGVAREFNTFCEIEKELVTYDQVVKDPMNTPVPTEPSTQYFVCGSLAAKVVAKDLPNLIKFVERMGVEFQIICFRALTKRNPQMKAEPALRAWITKNAHELMD